MCTIGILKKKIYIIAPDEAFPTPNFSLHPQNNFNCDKIIKNWTIQHTNVQFLHASYAFCFYFLPPIPMFSCPPNFDTDATTTIHIFRMHAYHILLIYLPFFLVLARIFFQELGAVQAFQPCVTWMKSHPISLWDKVGIQGPVAKFLCSAWLGAPRAGLTFWNYPVQPYSKCINTIRQKGSAWRVLPTYEY